MSSAQERLWRRSGSLSHASARHRRPGVFALPGARAVEMTNFGMDRLEAENRIRQEIEAGRTTLGKVVDLFKWDKKGYSEGDISSPGKDSETC